ncbi:solute carrier family 22 member 2 [Lingula anatina]|uniref:Solute carrier family 22 member 2 n=1 Tax=Lingula anatina TaxID=7574 RepID=A0A1S3KAA3_LINAN|nr:solute carrier family 22 member 2 [Lingula anatina]|eukprot:XP_013419558.1 solute carrier family 22 member 2 [Lingula anatina]
MEGTKLNGESSSDDPKDFDDILVLIGEFGTFQRLIYTLLALACMLHSVIYVAVVFIEETPGHRCKIPGLLNDTNNVSIPNETGVATQQCTFIQNVSHQGDYSQDKTEPEPCTEWVFDTSTVTYSYPMQFGLICTDSLKLTQSHIMLIAGSIAGAPVFGSISDSLGRRFSLLLSLSVSSVLGLAWALTPSYLWGIIIRFVYGLTSATINSVGTTAVRHSKEG